MIVPLKENLLLLMHQKVKEKSVKVKIKRLLSKLVKKIKMMPF